MILDRLLNLQGTAIHIGLDRRHIEDRHGHLGIRRLRAELVVGIAQALADRIHTDQGAGAQEVLALQAARAHRVLLCPQAVLILRQQLARGQLVARVAASGRLGIAKVGRARLGGRHNLGRLLHSGLTGLTRHIIATSGHRVVRGAR